MSRSPREIFALAPTSLEGDAFDPGVVIGTEGHHVRIILQSIVHDPAIVGVHRIEFDRSARDPDGVGDLPDPLAQFVVPHRAPVSNVDLDTLGIPVLSLQDSVQKELQIFQRFAVVSNQRLAFGSKDLELTTAFGLDFLYFCDEAQVTKHRVQNLLGFHFILRVRTLGLAISFAFCNLGIFGDLHQRRVCLVSRQIHLGHEKEVLHRPVQRQPGCVIIADE